MIQLKGIRLKIYWQMKFCKSILIFFVFVFFALTTVSFAQIPDEIVSSIQSGNDVGIAAYFNENVELTVGTHDDAYSKSQTQQIIAEFFKTNKPKQFSIIKQGEKEGSQYLIGILVASSGKFRIYFLLKSKNNVSYIHMLKIEKQN